MLFSAGRTAPHAFAKAPLSAEGLKPSKSRSFTLGKEKIRVPRKHSLSYWSWKAQDAPTPSQPIARAPGTSRQFLALLAACQRVRFHLAKRALGS